MRFPTKAPLAVMLKLPVNKASKPKLFRIWFAVFANWLWSVPRKTPPPASRSARASLIVAYLDVLGPNT